MQKITPFLWFDNNAEEALDFYAATFKEAEITSKNRQTPDGPLFTGGIKLFGQEFAVLNGGPQFKFNEAVSFVINCTDQEEVDYYWNNLADGGQPLMCGWVKDKFGVVWQVVPTDMFQYIGGQNKEGAKRAHDAMMKMQKLDINELKKAYDGEE